MAGPKKPVSRSVKSQGSQRRAVTSAGNRIDDRLAWGLARSAVRQADLGDGFDDQMDFRNAKLGNPKGRLRTIKRIKAFFAKDSLSLGVMALADYTQAKFAHIGMSRWGYFPESIAINTSRYEFVAGKGGWGVQVDDPVNIANVDVHALQRLAKRRGERDLEGFMAALNPIWGWCSIANELDVRGAYMVPVEEGIVCCRREAAPLVWNDPNDFEKFGGPPTDADGPPPSAADYYTRVITFIDFENMREVYQQSWSKIVGLGALDDAPKFPRFSAPTDPQTRIVASMREEGAAWEARRDHAISMDGSEQYDREPRNAEI